MDSWLGAYPACWPRRLKNNGVAVLLGAVLQRAANKAWHTAPTWQQWRRHPLPTISILPSTMHQTTPEPTEPPSTPDRAASALVLALAAALVVFLALWLVHEQTRGVAQLEQLRHWEHEAHQRLRSAGARVNASVQQSASEQRVLAGDDAISAAVSDALQAAQSDELRALDIDTHHAMVTLRGTLPSPALRERAVAIVQAVPGVHGVFSVIDVVPPQPQPQPAEEQPKAVQPGDRAPAPGG